VDARVLRMDSSHGITIALTSSMEGEAEESEQMADDLLAIIMYLLVT